MFVCICRCGATEDHSVGTADWEPMAFGEHKCAAAGRSEKDMTGSSHMHANDSNVMSELAGRDDVNIRKIVSISCTSLPMHLL